MRSGRKTDFDVLHVTSMYTDVYEHSVNVHIYIYIVCVGFSHGIERHGIYVLFVLLWHVTLCNVV